MTCFVIDQLRSYPNFLTLLEFSAWKHSETIFIYTKYGNVSEPRNEYVSVPRQDLKTRPATLTPLQEAAFVEAARQTSTRNIGSHVPLIDLSHMHSKQAGAAKHKWTSKQSIRRKKNKPAFNLQQSLNVEKLTQVPLWQILKSAWNS